MESYNIIKILPNIYIYDSLDNIINIINYNSISCVIIINNINNYFFRQNHICEFININIDEDNINFNETNKLITNIIKKFNNILIISDKNIVGFTLMGAFLIDNLDVTFFQILVLNKYYNININKTNYYKLLYEYYNNKKKY